MTVMVGASRIVAHTHDPSRAERIQELVAALDGDDTNAAEEAQYALTEHVGADALEPLLAAAPGFSRFGALCAIEVFESIGDRGAAAVLIPWLRSEHDTVRDWSADALGRLGASEAVPDLRDALAAAKARGTPPDWTEPARIRDALARLGARDVVLPAAARRLEAGGHDWDHAWPASALPAVLGHLAEARQVIVYFQYWAPYAEGGPNSWIGVDAGEAPKLDWTRPWDALVAESSRAAIAAANASDVPSGTVATVEWIDESDI
jgi:hypothetical protein